MPAYLVVTLTVSNPQAFGRYRDAIKDLETRYGGRYLVRAPVREWLEGSGMEGERVVVMEFPDAAHVREFISSDAYQAAKTLRSGVAVLNMRLVTEDK